jgi:hypothetical protein
MSRFLLLCLAVFVLAGAVLWAQTETGQITGTVTDPTGAVIPNAKVTARSTTTGATRSTVTNSTGLYSVTGLLPGRYQVTVSNPGFSNMMKQVDLPVGGAVGLDFRMEVSQAATTVEVSAETPVEVNTETQTLGTVITRQQVIDLPTLTRNPYSLILTAPNVSDQDPAAQNNQVGQGAGAAINGQRASSTNVLLDGASNNDEFQGSIGQRVPLDSVAEFSILTSDFTATYGRAGGGIINVATKSGTNQFHGSAYEFNRVSRLASNSFDNNANGIDKPGFTRNQFGYSIGGPIMKDKLFFFNNIEWIRIRSSAPRSVYVPTQQFISAAAPATQDFFNAYGTLRSSASTLATYSKSDLEALGFNPCSGGSATGPCNALDPNMPMFTRVSYSRPYDAGGGTPEDTYMIVGRVDYNLSDKTQMYGRYALEHEIDQAGSLVDSPYQGFDTGQSVFNNNILFSVIHTFSPSFSEQSKIVFNRLNLQQPLGQMPSVPSLYVLPTQTTSLLGDAVAMPGYSFDAPGNAIPFGGPQNFIQLYQDQTWVKGSHAIRFGGSYVYLRDNRTFGAYQEAVEALGSRFGQGMDNFLLGQLYQFQAAIDPQGKFPCSGTPTPDCTVQLPVGPPSFSRSNRYQEFALYGQDSWRVKPRLTLNLGLRWEYYGVQHNKNPKLDSNYYDGSGATIFEQIRNGSVQIAPDSSIGGLWAKDLDNFAPRIGVAWDVFGDGRTSLRGGYGIGYERNFGNVTFNVIQNPPNYAVISLFAPVDLPTIPISLNNAGPLAGSTGSKPLPVVSLRNVNANVQTAYAHFWSVSLEHQFTDQIFGALSYSGSKGVDLYSLENPNLAGTGNVYLGDPCVAGTTPGDPGTCTSRLRTTQYSNINRRGNNGFSNYNALVVKADILNVHNIGLNLHANYTWSHAIDNLSSVFSVSQNNDNLGLLDPFNPQLDRGDAEFDVRHRVAISAIWDIPYRGGASSWMKQVLGGWTVAPIITATSGAPFTLFDSTNTYGVIPRAMFNGPVSNSGSSNPQPTGQPNNFMWITWPQSIVDHSYVNPITNTSDFGPFPANMTGRNAFRGPGQWHFDLGLYKTFRLTERYTLQLRGEAYNVMNHSNLILVGADNDISSITFADVKRGVLPTSLMEHRDIQLAARFTF